MQRSDTEYNAVTSYAMLHVIYRLNLFGGGKGFVALVAREDVVALAGGRPREAGGFEGRRLGGPRRF